MHFCYVDESGTGNSRYPTMAGVILNANRMHKTKKHWEVALNDFVTKQGKKMIEFKAKEFYRGKGVWRGTSVNDRLQMIAVILNWLSKRHHTIVFSGVDKNRFEEVKTKCDKTKEIGSLWRVMAAHLALSIQKANKSRGNIKGHTVLVFDNAFTEMDKFNDLILNSPDWFDTYYKKNAKDVKLNQIVDVPYYADSKKVPLLQIADLISFIIRRYVEIKQGEKAEDWEEEALEEYIKIINKMSFNKSTIYPERQCNCAEYFYDLAPEPIRGLGKQ